VDADETQPRNNAELLDETVVGAYFARLNELFDDPKNQKHLVVAFFRHMGATHFRAALETMAEMDRLFGEMRFVLSEFTGRRYFLFNMLTIEHLATAMKLYATSWGTMQDLVARLVNAVLNLGTADRDVRVWFVLRNEHVRSTGIPGIVKACLKALPVKDLPQWRNDAVHRGRIPDPDVEQLRKERNVLDSRRSPLAIPRTSEEEYKEGLSLLQSRLNTLANEKQVLWEQVHRQTILMTSAVARELAVKAFDQYKREAIYRAAQPEPES
jgi:hypothetical protein